MKKPIGDVLNNCFDRANLAVGYSAANRIMLALSNNKSQEVVTSPAFIMFTIGLIAMLIYLNSTFLQTPGIQISLCIVISNLMTSFFPLPEVQSAYIILTSILFYLILISALCCFVHHTVKTSATTKLLWEKIVPFLVLFTSAKVLKITTDAQQMKLLYLVALCYILLIQYYGGQSQDPDFINYFFIFVDSVMCRSMVLAIQDFATSRIDNMDIAVVVFNMAVIFLVYSVAAIQSPKGNTTLPSQVQYCLGVLNFAIAQQSFNFLLKLYSNQVMGAILSIITLMTLLHYSTFYNQAVYNICIFGIGIAWALLVESWLSSFYNFFEHVILYTIIFIMIHKLQITVTMIYEFTEGLLTTKAFAVVAYDYYTNMMVIPHESSTAVGLPDA